MSPGYAADDDAVWLRVPDYQASGLHPANTTLASVIDDQWRDPRSCPNRERRPWLWGHLSRFPRIFLLFRCAATQSGPLRLPHTL